MKTMKFQKMMVLVLAAAVWAGCTQENPVVTEEQVSEEQHTTVQFTATLAGKGGGATKALSSDGTATWAENEEIAVYYTTSSGHATATATVTSVDASGNATISATLTDAKDAGTVKFVYPATLHDGSGGINSTVIQLYQTGNLTGTNSISEYYDAATGDGTLTVSGGSASLSSAVSMTNPLCICEFQFYFTKADGTLDSNSPILSYTINSIAIKTGELTYYISSDRMYGGTVRNFNQDEDIYLAMYPASDAEFTFTAIGKTTTNSTVMFSKTVSGVTLEANKFYKKISFGLPQNNNATMPTGIYTGAISSTITVPAGETITLSNATCIVSSGPAIKCEGNATIILTGSNTVSTSASGLPAIQAGPSGTTLTIQGSGSLTATGGTNNAAGIGSGSKGTCGAITISGGTVTATGGRYAAGIGSGREGTCGDISISGGEVTATGGDYAAGIGSGRSGKFSTITIGSGITSVTATMGINAQAPIGRGNEDQGSGDVTIDDVLNPSAGASLTHLNWSVTHSGKTWTLTKKS